MVCIRVKGKVIRRSELLFLLLVTLAALNKINNGGRVKLTTELHRVRHRVSQSNKKKLSVTL